MNRNTPLRSVWAVPDDYCISAMQSDNKLSSGRKVNAFNDSRTNSDFNDSEKDTGENPLLSKPRYVLYEKPSNFVPFQNQGLFAVYEPKNNLNSETSEDFEAIPEEFRPNISVKHISPKNSFDENNTLEYTLKYDETQRNVHENVAQSPDIKETNPKGIVWNDNLKTDSSEIGQQFISKVQNSKFDEEQRKGNVQNAHMPKQSHLEDHRNNQTMSDRKNKEPRYRFTRNRPNPENSRVKEATKKQSGSSLTVLSQVTKLRVVTPDRQVETKKTVQTSWTTNPSDGSVKNKSENKSGTGEALYEHISHKAGRKNMTWMEDLCTVKESGKDDKSTFEYVYRASGRCSPPEQTKAPQQRKKINSSANNTHFDRNKDVPNEARYSRNTFTDHAEEFIRAQYRYNSEPGSQKYERINMPNRHFKEEVPVIKHIVEVIHVNQPMRGRGRRDGPTGRGRDGFTGRGRDGFTGRGRGRDGLTGRGLGRSCLMGRGRTRDDYYANRSNGSKFASDDEQHGENKTTCENPDLSWNLVDSNANETQNDVNENDSTLYQFSSRSTTNDQRFVKNKSKINVIEETESGLFSQSKGAGRNYSVFSTTRTTRFESPRVVDNEDVKSKRSLLVYYGAEISDTIVGSYTAMNMFLSFYKEWQNLRVKAMQLLENIVGNISTTSGRRSKAKNFIEIIGNGGRIVAAIPDIRAALGGRIVAVLSDFFAKIFCSSPTLKDSGMNEFELMMCLQQDIDATSDMNIFGLQCDQNFQETCKIIEEFHTTIQGWCFKDITEGVDADFLEDISTMNPKHHIVYYRRLQKWLERFAEDPSTDISRAFTRGFKDFPDALKTTNLLHWRFHTQGIDETVSLRSWEEIRKLLQNGDSVAVVDVLKKIQNSILVLIKERSAMEKDVMELLNTKKDL